MKIYEVHYTDETGRDGYGRQYFTNRQKAAQCSSRLRREYRQASAKLAAAQKAGVNFYSLPAHPGPAPEPTIRPLTFTGTPVQMVLAALEHNA